MRCGSVAIAMFGDCADWLATLNAAATATRRESGNMADSVRFSESFGAA